MNETEEIDLKDLFEIIWKKRMMILSITIAFMLVGLLYSAFFASEKYETFTTLRMNILDEKANEGDYDAQLNALAITDRLINTYGEIAKSKTVANEVIEKLDLDMTYKSFTDKIEVSVVPGTEIIKIEVKGSDAKQVADIANEVSQSFLKNVSKFIKEENVRSIQVIDTADVPKESAGSGKLLNVLTSTILGAMIGVFVTFLLNYLDRTVRKTEELERDLELTLLAEIDDKDPNLNESYKRLRTNLEHGVLNNEEKVLMVTSTIEDEGKTDIVYELSKSMSDLGKKVLLIDCNLVNPEIKNKLNTNKSDIGLVDILSRDVDYKSAINPTEFENLHVITTKESRDKSAELLDSKEMLDLINTLKVEYDFILLDTPSIKTCTDSLVLSTMSDVTIFVSKLGHASREDILKSKQELTKVNANIVGLVVRR